MPTSVDWVKDDQSHMVAAYTNADCVIYDIETGNPVIKLDTMSVSTYLNPIMPGESRVASFEREATTALGQGRPLAHGHRQLIIIIFSSNHTMCSVRFSHSVSLNLRMPEARFFLVKYTRHSFLDAVI